MVRPVAEYCAVVFYPMLTDEQDELLERQQSHALKLIFGPNISTGKMREMAGIPTLRQRRLELSDKFATKAVKNPRFSHWFPIKKPSRATRSSGIVQYEEKFARCKRLKNSPLFFMCRRLNEKPGKLYCQRKKFWRER